MAIFIFPISQTIFEKLWKIFTCEIKLKDIVTSNMCLFVYEVLSINNQGRVWGNQRCSQKPSIDEGRTMQWSKKQGEKDKQWSIKYYTEN